MAHGYENTSNHQNDNKLSWTWQPTTNYFLTVTTEVIQMETLQYVQKLIKYR